jgi:transcriptional regulator with XRE-family HTH domain
MFVPAVPIVDFPRTILAYCPSVQQRTTQSDPAARAAALKPSVLVPRRAPGTSGRHPPNYPDLNFQALGAALGLSPTYVGRILNGVSRPSMPVAERLAALMGWSIDQINQLYNEKRKSHGKSRNRSTYKR